MRKEPPPQGGRIRGLVRHDLDALRALYAEADKLLDGWTCETSNDCCHFGRTGREPFLWPNEFLLLERALPAPEPTPTTRRGRLRVLNNGGGEGKDEDRCPVLTKDGRCGAYAERPFGCRTFYCERASGPTRKLPRAELADIGRRIADLARAGDPSTDGPRLLLGLLESRPKRPRR